MVAHPKFIIEEFPEPFDIVFGKLKDLCQSRPSEFVLNSPELEFFDEVENEWASEYSMKHRLRHRNPEKAKAENGVQL